MSQSLRRLLAGSAAAAAVLALAAFPVSAAPPADDAAPPTAVAASAPGKGDSDGDRIADDLEAALADLAPGDRVAVIVQGTTPADAHRAAPSLALGHEYTIIPAFAGSVTAGQVTALSHIPGVTRVELDGVARATDASGDAITASTPRAPPSRRWTARSTAAGWASASSTPASTPRTSSSAPPA